MRKDALVPVAFKRSWEKYQSGEEVLLPIVFKKRGYILEEEVELSFIPSHWERRKGDHLANDNQTFPFPICDAPIPEFLNEVRTAVGILLGGRSYW